MFVGSYTSSFTYRVCLVWFQFSLNIVVMPVSALETLNVKKYPGATFYKLHTNSRLDRTQNSTSYNGIMVRCYGHIQ